MGRVVYSMSVSLDGFAADADGSIDWVIVDEELHEAFNDEARQAGVFLYGRRMYELMTGYWPTAEADPTSTAVERDFARIWRDMPKLVASRTLVETGWGVQLVKGDVVDEVARLRSELVGDIGVGGPTLAATLLRAGLVDDVRVYVNPVVLGGGLPFFPDGLRLDLRLVDTRRFAAGVVLLRYAMR
ncbi:MAG TPA: dihydrofolate reductase family protein [Candidatus Limnocylindrales bacterium]